MAEIGDLVPIDDNNTGRWPEGMPPSNVNNAGRSDEGILSRWHRDSNGSLTSTGSGTAYQLTTNQNLTAYYDGLEITFVAHVTSGATPTLQLGTLTAAQIQTSDGSALSAGDISAGGVVNVISQDNATTPTWRLMNVSNIGNVALLNADNQFTGVNTFTASNQLMTFTDDGTTSAPTLYLERNRTTPAVGDQLGSVFFDGFDSSGTNQNWGSIRGEIVDPTNGSHSGLIKVRTAAANVFGTRLDIARGLIVPNGGTDPDGGDLGFGWINVREGVALNGVEYQAPPIALAQTTLSGTSTSLASGSDIPSDARIIFVTFNEASSSINQQPPIIRIGPSGGVVNTGYSAHVGSIVGGGGAGGQAVSDGFYTARTTNYQANDSVRSWIVLKRWDAAENIWHASGNLSENNDMAVMAGGITLTGALTDIEIHTPGGTATLSGEARVEYQR